MEVKAGYKRSEVGAIPVDWETRRLGELLQGPRSIRYGIVQPGKFEATGCYMLRSQDYSKGWTGSDKMHKVSVQLEFQYRNARILHNDLVMTIVGAGIGQVVIVPDWLNGAILSRSTARIAIDEDKAARSFVREFLEGPFGKRQILDCQKEGAQPVVSCLDLAKFFVAYPPLPEQRAIAAALSDIDGLVDGLDRLIAKKRDLKQAAMQQLLTGQIRLPTFSREWEVKRLGDLADMGSGGTPTSSVPRYYDGDIPWVSISDMTKGGKVITETDRNLTHAGFAASATQMFPAGTVLYAMYASLGECSIAGISVCSSQAILGIRPKSSLNNEFLYYYLTLLKLVVKSMGQQGTQANLNKGMVQDFRVALPSVEEQSAIAAVLSDMDAELFVLEGRRDKTRALKQAMMQELLSGQTRLISPEEVHA